MIYLFITRGLCQLLDLRQNGAIWIYHVAEIDIPTLHFICEKIQTFNSKPILWTLDQDIKDMLIKPFSTLFQLNREKKKRHGTNQETMDGRRKKERQKERKKERENERKIKR